MLLDTGAYKKEGCVYMSGLESVENGWRPPWIRAVIERQRDAMRRCANTLYDIGRWILEKLLVGYEPRHGIHSHRSSAFGGRRREMQDLALSVELDVVA